jgi:POT family proton-dependent oligopeptide transporter
MEKHPKSLSVFFATEMWERYGFYVVQSLLALYLAMQFQWPDKQIYALVGSFTALTYLSPLVGGWIADKLLGQKRAIILGALVLFTSYCVLSLLENNFALTASLAGIAVGTGLLKPNISSLLGNEYLQNSPRRESGFTIFYMGITSGIILGTTLPSHLSKYFGWPTAFVSASIGMLIALAIFVFGIIHYKIKDYNSFKFEAKNALMALLLMLALWFLSFYVLNSPQLANALFIGVVLFSAVYILYAVSKENEHQAKQTLVIGLLCIISVMFWAFYFQMFMSLTLFIARMVQPTFCGIEFHPPYYITIQSIGMLIIGGLLARKYPQKTLRERGLSTGKKFILAMCFMTIAYAIISFSSYFIERGALLSPLLIIPAYLMISLAELLLSPVGLAAITFLADKNKVSTMMGIFFASLGIGGFLAGKLASLSAIPKGETNVLILKNLYANAFTQQLWILIVATLGCLVLYAVIKVLLAEPK